MEEPTEDWRLVDGVADRRSPLGAREETVEDVVEDRLIYVYCMYFSVFSVRPGAQATGGFGHGAASRRELAHRHLWLRSGTAGKPG